MGPPAAGRRNGIAGQGRVVVLKLQRESARWLQRRRDQGPPPEGPDPIACRLALSCHALQARAGIQRERERRQALVLEISPQLDQLNASRSEISGRGGVRVAQLAVE